MCSNHLSDGKSIHQESNQVCCQQRNLLVEGRSWFEQICHCQDQLDMKILLPQEVLSELRGKDETLSYLCFQHCRSHPIRLGQHKERYHGRSLESYPVSKGASSSHGKPIMSYLSHKERHPSCPGCLSALPSHVYIITVLPAQIQRLIKHHHISVFSASLSPFTL